MSHYGLTYERIRAATEQHGTVFFDADLNPVQPEPGQWFCEFDCDVDYEGEWFVRDEAFVRYEGLDDRHTLDGDKWVTVQKPVVWPEGADECREPAGYILIAQ